MGFIKNFFKYDKIEWLKAGYAIGHVRGKATKDLLKNGKVLEENICSVSNNMLRNVRDFNESIFLVRKEDAQRPNRDEEGNFLYKDGKWEPYYDYTIIDRQGNVIFKSLNEVVRLGGIKEDLVNFDNSNAKIKQYVFQRGSNSFALLIPSRHYVSDWFKEIGEPDEQGRRKVTESDLDTRLKQIPAGRNLSYYINEVGERVSPQFVSEVDAGDYVILWAPDDQENMYDYICDKKDFSRMSYGHPTIEYSKGKFFAKNGPNTCFLIDEQGKRISSNLTRYWVLDNGTAVCEENYNKVNIYNKDYKLCCVLDNPVVCGKTGVVVGRVYGEKDYVMFGLDLNKKYPVNRNCAELIIKILGGSVPPKHYTAGLVEGLTEADIEQTVTAYEEIMKENSKLSPDNAFCKILSVTAKLEFLKELKEAMQFSVRKTRNELKDLDKEKFKKTKLLRGKIKQKKLIEEILLDGVDECLAKE